ncbi:CRISPR-associated helicase/endonuclease Cas3 [Clostridium botulinum]|uniref:CRISPR-associated helicase/endonuclease Cas3 n=1 Tax=Clostridium botulinum TaxID=1491 RepID=UPI0007E238E1|nr:CRISPR-associated helicase/endonuclease Cas3 [Clostridium botulinum]KEI81383.1 CRISPR-associated protein Cas3 [Clostridium botulinum B2 331]NFA89875.1 CRISPR-associated helicase/endonuclease Cas3 [Clostridium botulinum]NFB20445.1 CRISPR-associated helicase/endonuclease Cas3 [Clostridium botulinum]NFT55724.1 CRISPR-associated helicase/endonuclease Cas3 [Clostridium botulinum]
MYFINVEKFPIDKFVKNHSNIYAHKSEDNSRFEILKDHLELSEEYLYKVIKAKNLDNVLMNFQNCLFEENCSERIKIFKEMIFNIIYMHDMGKINCCFQYKKMDNELFKEHDGINFNYSNHSMLSSLIYINYYFKRIKELKNVTSDIKDKLRFFMMINSYIISRHHSHLDSFNEYKNKFLEEDGEGKRLYFEQLCIFKSSYDDDIVFEKKPKLMKKLFELTEDYLNNELISSKKKIYLYIYERFFASLLLGCDYYSTSQFMNNCKLNYFGEITDINKFYDGLKKTEIYNKIRDYEKEKYLKYDNFNDVKDINILRNEMFLDAEKMLEENIESNIYYLEAPTGSGKSTVALNLSFKLIEQDKNLNKIFNVYPFNTLVEQNIASLNKIFDYDKELLDEIAVINSLVPIKEVKKKEMKDEENEEVNYDKSLLNRQFLNYSIVLNTHVSMFNYLFGTAKDDLFPLIQLANSVIVLDEIQSYKNNIWKEIIMFLNCYAEILNIKIIIMSATLPNLNKLIDYDDFNTINLIKNRDKYFKNPLFKDRVLIDFSLLGKGDNTYEVLKEHVLNTSKNTENNILIELINKNRASEFYNDLIMELGNKKKVLLITGDDNSIERNEIIKRVKEENNIVLVATQVIEAGVDIDMDIGYKDISMLDSDEQFLGRINRSCKKPKSIVCFFDLDSASSIYKGDYRKEKNVTLKSNDIRDILIKKDFQKYYDLILKRINDESSSYNENNIEDFINDRIGKLNFLEVEKKMKLIDDDKDEVTVFLCRNIILENGQELDGKKVWEDYKELLKDGELRYSEKKVKLSKISSNLNYFIYKVKSRDFPYNDRLGEIYCIYDGENYFSNGKFDRKNFIAGASNFIEIDS